MTKQEEIILRGIIKESVDENLGTFGKAVKNGWLRDNFAVEEAQLSEMNGKKCLRCKMGRWFGKDDEIILFPDGTGVNTDETATDKEFKWKSVRVRTTSFAKSILAGAGIGAAVGATGGIGYNAMKGASLFGGQAAGTAIGNGVRSAASGLRRKVGRLGGSMMRYGYGPNIGPSDKARLAKAAGVAIGTTAGVGGASYLAGRNSNQQQVQQKGTAEGQVNEVAPLVTGAIGAGIGAVGGGIYALVKNRNNIVYYSDGSYKSMNGDVNGRWDGKGEIPNNGGQQSSDNSGDAKTREEVYKEIAQFSGNPKGWAKAALEAGWPKEKVEKYRAIINGGFDPQKQKSQQVNNYLYGQQAQQVNEEDLKNVIRKTLKEMLNNK